MSLLKKKILLSRLQLHSPSFKKIKDKKIFSSSERIDFSPLASETSFFFHRKKLTR